MTGSAACLAHIINDTALEENVVSCQSTRDCKIQAETGLGKHRVTLHALQASLSISRTLAFGHLLSSKARYHCFLATVLSTSQTSNKLVR